MLRRIRLDVPGLLSVIYAPLQPIVKRLHLTRRGSPRHRPEDIQVPDGYRVELVAGGFTAPVHGCFDPDGTLYVTESGHKSDAPPRVFALDVGTGDRRLVVELSEGWSPTGAATGAAWHDGSLYVAVTDRVLRLNPASGAVDEVVTGLPGLGDHHTNHPIVGPNNRLYWGQGCVTNLGVVGADNFGYEWLAANPDVHDVPATDVELVGRTFEQPDVLHNPLRSVTCAAFAPFGKGTDATHASGAPVASGAVISCELDGSDVRTEVWGLRNPYGIALHPDGRLFVTEHGSDERGARWIIGDPDDLYEIVPGAWYGWPDFASGIRLDDPRWGTGGLNREPVLATFPDDHPPMPTASFETHAAANGFDFSRSDAFGFTGQAFVALFGDLAPLTTPRQVVPAGFKVVRVDPDTGQIRDFAVNRTQGPASKLLHGGFERPSHCIFGTDDALYVIDYGVINLAPEKGGIRSRQGTGAVWRIRRDPSVIAGELPAPAGRVPFYPIQAGVVGALAAAALAALVALLRRVRRR
jgi:glucose/arabinose dehydrogenase